MIDITIKNHSSWTCDKNLEINNQAQEQKLFLESSSCSLSLSKRCSYEITKDKLENQSNKSKMESKKF